MRFNFWNQVWAEGNIGFHQAGFHPALEAWWPSLGAGRSVLVPLCGKSLDLLWLERQGHDVTGVEFVESAALDFFEENGLAAEKSRRHGFPCYQAATRKLRILVADFVRLAAAYRGPAFAALYDRAALVALPEDMRPAYVEACGQLLGEAPRGLLITLDYEPAVMEGPPFSVPPGEVEALWGHRLELLERTDGLAAMPRALAAGVTRLEEYTWALR